MPPAKDLTGQVFGYLTVVSKTADRDSTGSVIWACTCKCGNRANIAARFLTQKESNSCGCLKVELLAARSQKDLTNREFGRLRAVRQTEERKNGCVIWECACECGNTVYVRASSLVSGNTRSCGCYNNDLAAAHMKNRLTVDLVDGTKLGALNDTPPRNNKSGVRGVYFQKSAGKWRAAIDFKNVTYFLGYFSDIEEAAKARKIAEDELWKPFLEKYLGDFRDDTERRQKLQAYLQEKIAEKLSA